jgi:hypothetical protein
VARPRKIGDRYVVAENAAQIVEVAFFVSHGDQPPVAVPGRNTASKDRTRLAISLTKGVTHVGDHAGQSYNCNQHEKIRLIECLKTPSASVILFARSLFWNDKCDLPLSRVRLLLQIF